MLNGLLDNSTYHVLVLCVHEDFGLGVAPNVREGLSAVLSGIIIEEQSRHMEAGVDGEVGDYLIKIRGGPKFVVLLLRLFVNLAARISQNRQKVVNPLVVVN